MRFPSSHTNNDDRLAYISIRFRRLMRAHTQAKAIFLAILMVLMVQTAYVLGTPSAEPTINSESANAYSGNSTAPLHVLVNNTEMDPISFTSPWPPNNNNSNNSGSGGGSSGNGSSGSGLTTYNGNGTTWQAFDLFGQVSSSPMDLTPIGDVLYFSTGGSSLWAYNTSNQTEWEVHDFNPNGSDDIREIFALGTRLYFEAKDDNNPSTNINPHLNKQLWTYETTNDTAWKLTNHTFVSQVGTNNNVAKYLFDGGFSLMGTRLYFTAKDSNGVQIWAHETTNESTWAVTNIGAYGVDEGSNPILVMGSQLYFGANNGDTEGGWGSPPVRNELWAYDTTNETAWMTSNLCTPDCGGFSSSDSMTSIGTRIFFTGTIKINQTFVSLELFAHETTNGSTWLVEDIWNGSSLGYPREYISMGSTIYFEAEDSQSGREPWAYDVTNDTTWQVCDINPNSSVNGGDGDFLYPFAIGDRIFFQGDDGIHGSELWTLDTINGTCWMVADINTYSAGISSIPEGFAAVGNQLYFQAYKKVGQNHHGSELWVHDPANLTFNGSGGSSGTSGGGGGGSTESVIWSISPSLPTGVTIDQVDGTISGTPTQVMANTTYTVLATHSSGNSTTFEVSLMVLEDTDGDGDPDSLPVDYDTTGPTPGLVEDIDDDNDGYPDDDEAVCSSNPLDHTSVPADNDGDLLCDLLDSDDDNDGYNDTTEIDCETYPLNASSYPTDSDSDGECDVLDPDDDNDGYNDTTEVNCLSDPYNASSIPTDSDSDGECDVLDPDDDNDGVLDVDEVLGCTNSTANNFFANATEEDGTCDHDLDDDGVLDADEIDGCTNSTANNFNANATDDDGTCDYDLDDDGILDADEIDGCTNSTANNFDALATDDDGTCDYDLDDDGVLDADEVPGCTNSTADNFDANATDDDGSCEYVTQTDDSDGDGWNDTDESDCGTDPLDGEDTPLDIDQNGICDALDPITETESEDDEDVEQKTENLSIFSMWSCYILLLILLLIFAILYRQRDEDEEGKTPFVAMDIDDSFDEEVEEEIEEVVEPMKNKDEEYDEIYGADDDGHK